MTKRQTLAISTISLLALGTVAVGCGEMDGSGEEKVVSALAGQLNVAFQGNDHFLKTANGGFGSNSNILMTSGTVPSQVIFSSGSTEIGFRRSDGHFVVDRFTPPSSHVAMDSNGLMAGGSSPSLAACPGCSWAFAFYGVNGHLFIGEGGSPFTGHDTNGAMAGGTSPSIAMKFDVNRTVTLAFQGSNGHLWVGFNGPTSGFDTLGAMAGGTSPSIATSVTQENGNSVIAFQGSNGHLWLTTTTDPSCDHRSCQVGVDTGAPGAMKAGTSPSVAVQTNGVAVVAFQSNAGVLKLFTPPNTFTDTQVFIYDSPSIVATPSGGFQVNFHRVSNLDLWIDLNGVFQDQGFQMN